MKRYLFVASLPFIILEQPGVMSFAVSRCAFRGDKTNVEISKQMLLMIRRPFTHSAVTSTVTRHMSLDNDNMQAKQDGIPGIPPAPRPSPADQQQQQQQQRQIMIASLLLFCIAHSIYHYFD